MDAGDRFLLDEEVERIRIAVLNKDLSRNE
jgi:hypothetical protein